MLEYFDIVDQVFEVCCNCNRIPGKFHGAIFILAELIDEPLFWQLCRCHKLEVHSSHVMESLTDEKTNGQSVVVCKASKRMAKALS